MCNDEAAADASKELQIAREERDASRRVEVIRSHNNGRDEDEEVVVYASGMFEDGKYANNPNLWDVPMEKSSNNVCRLADLRDCHVCVGGGFPVASLDHNDDDRELFELYIDGDDSDSDAGEDEATSDACSISFCFSPHSTWVKCLIHGWPREQWEQVIRIDNMNHVNLLNFLVDVVAVQYSNTTIEFEVVTFVTGTIHGALKRLLPPKRKEEVRANRDQRIKAKYNPDGDALYIFIARTMRERGNTENRVLFMPKVYSIMGFLSAHGVDRLGENDDLIILAIQIHEAFGDEGLYELSERLELVNDGEDDDETDEEEEREEEEEGNDNGDD